MERREAIERSRVDVRLVIEQEFGYFDVATVCGHVKRRQEVARGLVNEFGRVVEENAGGLDMVALSGHVKWGEAIFGFGVDRRVTRKQQLHDLVVAGACGTMKRRESVAGLDVDFATVV